MNAETRLSALLGVLFCMIIAAYFVNADPGGGSGPKNETRRDVPQLKAVDAARVFAVEMSDAKGTVRLEKTGDEWVLPNAARAPVRKAEIDELLRLCGGLEKAEFVAYDTTLPTTYGLDPIAVRRLKLFDGTGAVLADLWVGKDDQAGGKAATEWGTFVRADGATAIFSHRTRLNTKVRPGVNWWIEKQLFPGDPKSKNALVQSADRIVLEFADVPAAVPGNPAETQPAAPAQDPADAPRVRVVLEAKEEEVAAAAPAAPVGPTPGNQPPAATGPTKKKVWRIVEPADAGIEVFDGAADGVVRAALFASMMEVVGADGANPTYALDRPSASAEIRFSDGSLKRVVVGARAAASTDPAFAGQPSRFATASGSSRVVRLPDYVAQQFRKKPADFKAPEAPKPVDVAPPPISLPEDGAATKPADK